MFTFFTQLQMALRDDPAFVAGWPGVLGVYVDGDPWYVAMTTNIGPAVCAHGEWPGDADLVVRVATHTAWTAIVADPSTIPAIADAGLIVTDDPDSQSFTLARLGAMIELRNAWVLAHPPV